MLAQDETPLEAMEPSLKDAIQADLTRLRAIAMRFAERIDAKAETAEGDDQLTQLNAAAVKAARAVRQIGVLQLEIAGLRQQPGSRAPAAPAKENTVEPRGNGPKPRDYAWAQGDYTEYDDYTDWELDACRSAKRGDRILKIAAAMRKDFTAYAKTCAVRRRSRLRA